MTITQAIKIVAERYSAGKIVHWTQIQNEVVKTLKSAGHKKNHYGGTIQREYRKIKDDIGLIYDRKIQMYRKVI